MTGPPPRRRKRRAVRRYLKRVPFLPSLLTLGNAFCGLLAIVKITDAARAFEAGGASNAAAWALVEMAGLLIFLAMVFDGLDGKVARLTSQTSDFGAQLDSLADVVTFGIAPAVIAKFLIDAHQGFGGDAGLLPYHPKIYYVCAATYSLFAVLRLARFNVEVQDADERAHLEFEGLPTPAAAALVSAVVLFWCAKGQTNSLSSVFFEDGIYDTVIVSLPFVLVVTGLLMVSRIPYPHLLNYLVAGGKSFHHLVAAVIILVLGVLEWQIVVLALGVAYALLGPALGLFRLVTGRRGPMVADDDDGFDAEPLDGDTAEADDDRGRGAGLVDGPGSRRSL